MLENMLEKGFFGNTARVRTRFRSLPLPPPKKITKTISARIFFDKKIEKYYIFACACHIYIDRVRLNHQTLKTL